MVSRVYLVILGVVMYASLLSADEAQTEETVELAEVLNGGCEADSIRSQLCSVCPMANCCNSNEVAQLCYNCALTDDGVCEFDDSEEDSDSGEMDKRGRRLIGKRARRLIGKRGRRLIGKRGRRLIGKRARRLIG